MGEQENIADIQEAFEDIPGTCCFDAKRSRMGYHLNMFCMSLMKAENRQPSRRTRANISTASR